MVQKEIPPSPTAYLSVYHQHIIISLIAPVPGKSPERAPKRTADGSG